MKRFMFTTNKKEFRFHKEDFMDNGEEKNILKAEDLPGVSSLHLEIPLKFQKEYAALEKRALFGRQAMNILSSLSRDLLILSHEEILRQISVKARQLLDVPVCILWKLDRKDNKLKIVESCGNVSEEYKKIEINPNDPTMKEYLDRRNVGYLIDATRQQKYFKHSKAVEEQGWVSLLSAPMKVDGDLIGMLDIFTLEKRLFEDWEKEFFGIFANYAAVSIQRGEILIKLKSRQEQNLQLGEIIARIHSSDNFDHMLHFILIGATASFGLGFNRALLLLKEETTNTFTLKGRMAIGELTKDKALEAWKKIDHLSFDYYCCIVQKKGISDTPLNQYAREILIPLEDGSQEIIKEVFRSGKRRIISKFEFSQLNESLIQKFDPTSDIIAVPLVAKGNSVGVLIVDNKFNDRTFSADEVESLQALADQAAIAIFNSLVLRQRDNQSRRERLITEIRQIVEWPFADKHPGTSYEKELDETLDCIVKKTAEALHAKECFLRLLNKTTNNLDLRAYYDGTNKKINLAEARKFKLGEGIAGFVAQTGRAYICPDVSIDEHYAGPDIGGNRNSILSVPIKSGSDDVVATLSVGSDNKAAFGEEEKILLEGIARSVLMAIERANLMDTLFRLAEEAAKARELDHLLNQLTLFATDLMREPVCLVWLLDKDKNGFTARAFHGPAGQNPDLSKLFISNNTAEIAEFLQREKPLYIEDARQSEAHAYRELVKELDWKSMLAIPLTSEGCAIGILQIYSYQEARRFTTWQLQRFKTFAAQASLAIENCYTRMRLEALNQVNQEMTEIPHKKEFLDFLLKKSLVLVGSNIGCVSLLDYNSGELKIVASEGIPDHPLKLGQGITGKALLEEKPIRVDDVLTNEWRDIYFEARKDTRSELVIPIVIYNSQVRIGQQVQLASKPIGVLNIESPTIGAFSEKDEQTLAALARQAAMILDRIEFDKKLDELRKAETTILAKTDGEGAIGAIREAISKILGYEWVNISLINLELGRIKSEHVFGLPEYEKETFKKLADHRLDSNDIQADIVRTRHIEVPEPDDPRFDCAIYDRFNHKKFIRVYIPMITSENTVLGTVEAGYEMTLYRKYIYEKDIQILKKFVDYVVSALGGRKRALLDKITHELRSPAVGIRNNASFLQRRWEELEKGRIEPKLNDIIADCEILLLEVEELEYLQRNILTREAQ